METKIVDRMTEEEYAAKRLEMIQGNHIWLNALYCIRPTDEFKRHLGDTILRWLNDQERLMPSESITSDNEHARALGDLTPVLYLNINKS